VKAPLRASLCIGVSLCQRLNFGVQAEAFDDHLCILEEVATFLHDEFVKETQLGLKLYNCTSKASLANMLLKRGDHHGAEAYARDALRCARAHGCLDVADESVFTLYIALVLQGDHETELKDIMGLMGPCQPRLGQTWGSFGSRVK